MDRPSQITVLFLLVFTAGSVAAYGYGAGDTSYTRAEQHVTGDGTDVHVERSVSGDGHVEQHVAGRHGSFYTKKRDKGTDREPVHDMFPVTDNDTEDSDTGEETDERDDGEARSSDGEPWEPDRVNITIRRDTPGTADGPDDREETVSINASQNETDGNVSQVVSLTPPGGARLVGSRFQTAPAEPQVVPQRRSLLDSITAFFARLFAYLVQLVERIGAL